MSALVAEEVVVALTAQTDRLERQLAAAAGTVDRRLGSMEKAGDRTSQQIEKSFNRIGGAAAGLRSVFAGISVAYVAQGLASLADESKKITAQLQLATGATGDFGKAQADVSRIATETRNGLSETATLYGSFVRASAEMGKNQEEAARATETFGKALKIGGAGASEAASATLQFGQALASGVLRGDEFNSIAEASPRILRLLADSFDVPIGKLRSMAEGGELTADRLYKALTDRKFTASIDEEFTRLPITFDEAMTQVHSAAVIAFGAFDRGGEFSTALASFVFDGAKGFADLEKKAEDFGVNVRSTFSGLSSAFEPLYDSVVAFFDFFERQAASSGINVKRDIQKSLDDLDRLDQFARKMGLLSAVPEDGGYGGRFRKGEEAKRRQLNAEREGRKLDATLGTYGSGSDFSVKDLYWHPDAQKAAQVAPSGGGKKSAKAKAGSKKMSLEERLSREPESQLSSEFLRMGQGPIEVSVDYQGSLEAYLEAQRRIEAEAQQLGEQRIHTLAGLFEQAFQGGTASIWDTFKQTGLKVVSEILARLVTNNGGQGGDIGSIFSSALGSVLGGALPGFATGGMLTIGGRGGVDRNLLSINGRPAAKVSQGEGLAIIPRAAGRAAMPSAQAPAVAAPTVNFTIHAPGATAETVSMIRRELMNFSPTIVQAAMDATNRQNSRPRL